MSPIHTVKNITLPQIDFDNFTYSISPERDIVPDGALCKSIAIHGILHPPIVREFSPDFYNIVTGRKRLLAARSLHCESACSALVISRQVPEVDVFSLLLAEIQLTRQLTMAERAIFLQKITAVADEKQIADEFLPRLGLAPSSFSVKQALELLVLEETILGAIHRGQIHETVAHDFVLLSAGDRMALFEIIASLRLSSSNQKKLFSICRELASRSNSSIAAVLDNNEVHAILHHPEANPPQKSKNLMLWLSRKHMPRSRQAEEEFSRFISGLRLPENVSIAHTPFFEDDSLTLAIAFPNRKSLQQAWEKIKHAPRSTDD